MYQGTVLVLALLASALAGPIVYQPRDQTTSCATRCRDTTKFRYVPGMTYEFDYNVQTHTAMEGASTERSSLDIRAIADIEVLSKCDMSLRLRDVKVYRSDPDSTAMKYADDAGEFRRVLERFPLRFSFQDGVIEELCPADGENTWALNIKRGVLTTLQNSMDSLEHDQRLHEVDVSGECPTQYTVSSRGWYTTSVRKTKDLLGCTDRTGFHSSVHAMQYRAPSDIQSLPLMKSSQESEQELDKQGIIKSVLIQEIHTFRPFSQANSGASTKVTQRLNFKSTRTGVNTRQDYIRNRAGLKFEHVYGSGNKAELMMDAENKLREICENTREDIRPGTPRLFSELVYIVKSMAISDLRKVYQQVKRGSICPNNNRGRKFFLDSIPMASTSATVEFMTEILTNREVNDVLAKMWIASISLVQNPTLEMLKAVKILLQTTQYTKAAMLPVSTMVNNYCNRRESCAEESVITNIIVVIEKVLGYGCYVRDSNLETSLMALRALGNAGHVDKITNTLSSCFDKRENPIEVRVTAIQAFRRLPCTADRSGVLRTYQDVDEDTEVRIAAYVAVTQCLTEDVLTRIQDVLGRERTSQVGSFVWSHLTNLQESSSPQKQAIRRILEDKTLKKEFDLDSLKYSRNYEGSLFLEKFNMGAMLESNVIFSEKSFLPRSTTLNMTVDLFGHSLNLFEVGGRVEGLEYLIETYLGPYSYFGGKKADRPMNKVNLDRLRGDLYLRIFGNEMYYNHFKGVDPLSEIKGFSVMDMLRKMSKNQDYSYTQSVMFLDSTMIIPTSSGLPLNLTVNGTATIDLNASGQVDLRTRTSPGGLLVEGHIQPSGAVQITGTMSIDAFVTKTGLRVVNTWHSSTALKGRVELSRGKILNVEIDFPQKKMEILDVSTVFFNVYGDVVREQKMLTDNRRELKLCTGSRLAEITGLELCNELQWANASQNSNAPYFPFTGPFSERLVLYKRDTHTGYYLMAKRSATRYSTVAQISLNMPGSRTDRSLSFDFAMDTKRNDIEMNLMSPWKKASLKGSISRNKNRVGMRGNLVLDGSQEYGIISEIAIQKEKNVITYVPRVEVRRPGSETMLLSGQIQTEGIKTLTTDLSLSGITSNAVTLRGSIVNSNIERSAKVTLSLRPDEDYSLQAGLVYQNMGRKRAIINIVPSLLVKTPRRELISLTGSGEYREGKSIKGGLTLEMDQVLDKPIIIKCDLKHTADGKNQYSGTVMVNSRVLVAKVYGKMQSKKSTITSLFTVDYNLPKIRSIKKDKIVFSSKYSDRSTKSFWNYHLDTNFEDKRFPEVNFFTAVDFTHNNKHTESNVKVDWGPKVKNSAQRVSVYALVNHAVDTSAKIDYNVKAGIGPLVLDLNLKGKHTHDPRALDSSFIFNYGKGKTIDATISLKNNNKRNLNLDGEINLSYPGKSLNLKTDLVQSRRDYAHTVSLVVDKKKSTVKTNYRRRKDSIHMLDSMIDISSLEPIQFHAMTDLDLKDFKASANANNGGEIYSASTTYKNAKTGSGKWTLDVVHPGRRVTVLLEGSGRRMIYQGTAETKWDADKDQSKAVFINCKVNLKTPGSFSSSLALKSPVQNVELNIKHAGGKQHTTIANVSWDPKKWIQVETSFRNDKTADRHTLNGTLRINTPFENYDDLFIQVGSDDAHSRFTSNGQFSWKGKKSQVTYALNVKKPYSLKDLALTVSGTSPFNGFRSMSAELNHNLQSSLNTVIKGNMEGNRATITVTGINRGTDQNRDIDGSVTWKSNLRGLKTAALRLSHKVDSRKFNTAARLDLNGDLYMYDMDLTHARTGWQIQNSGTLLLVSPHYSLTNAWTHRNTDSDTKSTLTSEWGSDKRIFIKFFGNYGSTAQTNVDGGMIVETPWKLVRKVEIDIDHEHGSGFIRHHSVMKQDNVITGSSVLNYRRNNRDMEGEFTLTSPILDIKGKTNARYDSYPLSGHAEVEWTPNNKASLDGSFSAPTYQDIETSIRFTTPFKYIRDTMLQASHKKAGSDFISRGSLNYGYRKSIVFESVVDADNLRKIRATLRTPFHNYRSVEGGFEYTGTMRNVDSRVNFAVKPILGNFAGILNWNTDSDLRGKMRIETPFTDYQYIQLFAKSVLKDNNRRSQFEVEYYPRKTISLDTSFKVGTPLMLVATLKTPYEDLEHLSASLKHVLRRKSMQSHAEVIYGPASTLECDLRMKWAKGIDSTVVITTPFVGYETTRLSVRHEGKWDDMKSHGEVEFGTKVGEADMEFQHGFKTTGSFSINTPIPGFETAKVMLNKRGNWDNMRGGIIISYGNSQTIDLSLQNKLTNRRLDTALIFKAPFCDDIRFTIDHDGHLKHFTTKVSGSVGSRHSIISETSVNMRYALVDVSTNLQYTINWKGGNIGLKIHKKGYMEDLSINVIGTLDKEQVVISGMFRNKNAIEGSLSMQAPIPSYSDIGLSFRHSGDRRRFTTKGNVRYMDGKALDGEITLSQNGLEHIDTKMEIKTPFNGYENILFMHRHSIGYSQATFNSDLQYGYGQRITSEINFETEPKLSLNIVVKTPFARMQTNKFAFVHGGSLFENCQSHAEIEFLETSIAADSNVEHDRSTIRVAATVITNIKDYELLKASLNSDGNWRNYRGNVAASLKDSAIEADLTTRVADDIKGTFTLKTPFQYFRDTFVSVAHSGEIASSNSEVKLRYMNGQVLEGKVSFSHTGYTQMDTRVELRTPFRNFEETIIEHSHTARRHYLKSNSALTYGARQKITSVITLDATRDINVNAVVRTPFKTFEITRAMVTLSTQDRNIRGNFEVECMRKTIEVAATFKGGNSLQCNLVVTTNIPGYENMRGTFISEGDWSDMQTSGLLNFNDSTLKAELVVKVKEDIQVTLTINTPFHDFRAMEASLRHAGSLSKFNSEGKLQYMDGKTVEGKVAFDGARLSDIRANAELKTPFHGYKRQSVDYHHSVHNDRLTSSIVAKFEPNMEVALTADGMVSPRIDINAELKTPFTNFENSRLVFTHEGPLADSRSHLEVFVAGKSIKADSEIEGSSSPRGVINLKTNIEGVKNVTLAYSKQGDVDNMKATGSVGIEGSILEVSLHHIITARRLFTEVTIKSPYTEDITMKVDIKGRPTNFKSRISASMGANATISSNSMFEIRNTDIDMQTELAYNFVGTGQSATLKFHKEGELNNMKMGMSGEYDGKKSSVNIVFRALDDVHGEVKISTPIKPYSNIGLSFDHSGSISRFTTQAVIRYMDRKEITGTLHHSNDNLDKIDSNLEVKTPISGYERTKAVILYTATSDGIQCHTGIQYGQGNEITGDLHGTISPKYEMALKIKTPFLHYEEISSSGSLELGTDRYAVNSNLNAGNGNRFSFQSKVDMYAKPMTANARITSPFKNFESAQIYLTHRGDLTNFRTTSSLETPITGALASEVSLRYLSPVEMDGSIILPHDVKFAVQNSHSEDKYRSHIGFAWGPRDEIAFDGSYQYLDNWNDKQLLTDATLTTPFEMARHTAVRFEHHQGKDRYTEKIEADYNGEPVLDMDVELLQGRRDQGSITMRKPRPMQMTLSGDIAEKNIDGEMFVNWDRDEPRSNIRVQTSLTDKSQRSVLEKDFKLKLIHPTRTFGINGNIMQSAVLIKSRGEFIWNEDAGQKVFYELNLKDGSRRNSQMYDGIFKLGAPWRTVQMDGSYSEKGARQTVDGSFSWDVERDAAKQVGLKAVLIPSDHNKKMELEMRLPSISKDIKLATELTLNDGRTLFHGKTDFIYSDDYRKTLTIFSRLDDMSYGYGNTNYSFAVGITHPHTDVNVQLKSHVGRSSDKYSGSVDLQYLTDRRENKNFALRGEIDRLRRQIELQMKSPMRHMAMMGEIKENPFQLNIINRYNDKTLQTQLSVDASQRAVDFNTNYDLNDPSRTLRLSARYVNSSALRAELYREVGSRRVQESLIAVRLNTSRLLHARLAWRPKMVEDLQEFWTQNVEQYELSTNDDLHSVYEALGDEMAAKYQRIISVISEEAAGLINLLEVDMAAIESQLESIRRDIRRMYRRNTLYIADMGDYFNPIIERYHEFVGATKAIFAAANERMSHFMETMKNYPIGQNYRAIVEDTVADFKRAVDRVVVDTVDVIARLDEELRVFYNAFHHQYSSIRNTVTDSISEVQNHPQVMALKSGITDTYQVYTNILSNNIRDLDIPKKYSKAVENAQKVVSANLAEIMKRDDVKHVLSMTNEAYQEGLWAYNYWQVEQNAKHHLQSIITMARDVAENEINQYAGQLKMLGSSAVTVWDPEHGEIQLVVHLPVPLKSLDSLQALRDYLDRVYSTVKKYTPDTFTVMNYYSKASVFQRSPRVSRRTYRPERI